MRNNFNMDENDVLIIVKQFCIIFVVLTSGVLINVTFLRNIMREERKERGQILQRHMINLSISQIVFWPTLFLSMWMIKIDQSITHLLDPCVYHNFGTAMLWSFSVFRLYIGMHSLIVAICRVSFIVYDQVILEFGIEKFKKVILFSSALLPIIIVLLAQGTIPIPNHDRTLSNMDIRCIESLRISNFSKPTLHRQTQLHMLVQKYLPSRLITCVKVFCYAVVLICISNILEGFIYWHTWSFIKRYW